MHTKNKKKIIKKKALAFWLPLQLPAHLPDRLTQQHRSPPFLSFIKSDVDDIVMTTGGRNRDRVGTIKNEGEQNDSFETIHVQDAAGHEDATQLSNVYTIGKCTMP
ncbi:hypothetical protein Dsin_005632 [Dipteronia sinensis]|uniref:Uncharacterized protein n=1 Tax=Dipteronia sinensis TaxID=43782 RepID=A0AAE0AXP2_9ROSI|nr:hypothetical protein Dsin_005632 [Dipteronia sinensis]